MKKIVIVHGDVERKDEKILIRVFDGIAFLNLEVNEDDFDASFTKTKYYEDRRNIYFDPQERWISPVIERWAKFDNTPDLSSYDDDIIIAMVHQVVKENGTVHLITYSGSGFIPLEIERNEFDKSFYESRFQDEGYNVYIDRKRKFVCPVADRHVKVLNLDVENHSPHVPERYDYHHDYA